jgi:hypothetical protein
VCVGVGVAGLPIACAGAVVPVPHVAHFLQPNPVDVEAAAGRGVVLLQGPLLLGCGRSLSSLSMGKWQPGKIIRGILKWGY